MLYRENLLSIPSCIGLFFPEIVTSLIHCPWKPSFYRAQVNDPLIFSDCYRVPDHGLITHIADLKSENSAGISFISKAPSASVCAALTVAFVFC
ncbi:hypothetical protein CS542_00520 [Pedobacter sp. IW39]|nr:hypothetical protein CS542_00520 [Pedobacter sp. IW39]